MEVANASHYDGATALAEGVMMAYNVLRGKRRKVAPLPGDPPRVPGRGAHLYPGHAHRRSSATTALRTDGRLVDLIDDDTACVAVQNPNFFGELDDAGALHALADAAHAKGALLIVAGYPIALGLFQPPGAYGADIAVGEAQPLGMRPQLWRPLPGLLLPAGKSTCARWPGGWSGRRSTPTASAAMC